MFLRPCPCLCFFSLSLCVSCGIFSQFTELLLFDFAGKAFHFLFRFAFDPKKRASA